MKKNIKWIALLAVVAIGVFVVGYQVGAGAAGNQPGSAGKATAALSDTSAGSNLASGKAITKHHSYLVRTNATGITATSDCKVYIIGNYEIN